MVLEVAQIEIHEGQHAAFTDAMRQAAPILMGSDGYLRHELHHCIEAQSQFILFVYWATLEDHTVGFRESQRFVDWRAILSPFFAKPPHVQHYAEVLKFAK